MPDAFTTDKIRFVKLHARVDAPVKWQWLFQGSMLRAETERGRSASISAAAFDELVRAGVMEPIEGAIAGVRLTEAGRDWVWGRAAA
jgi:hypothetical protein